MIFCNPYLDGLLLSVGGLGSEFSCHSLPLIRAGLVETMSSRDHVSRGQQASGARVTRPARVPFPEGHGPWELARGGLLAAHHASCANRRTVFIVSTNRRTARFVSTNQNSPVRGAGPCDEDTPHVTGLARLRTALLLLRLTTSKTVVMRARWQLCERAMVIFANAKIWQTCHQLHTTTCPPSYPIYQRESNISSLMLNI